MNLEAVIEDIDGAVAQDDPLRPCFEFTARSWRYAAPPLDTYAGNVLVRIAASVGVLPKDAE